MGDDWQSLLDRWEPVDPAKTVPPRLLGWKAVHRAVGFTHTHVYRMEQSGFFPQHFRLAGNRVVWLEADILAWMQARVDERKMAAPITVLAGDRFILSREIGRIVPYSVRNLHKLEKKGAFPRRIPIGPKRIAWLEREISAWLWEKRTPDLLKKNPA